MLNHFSLTAYNAQHMMSYLHLHIKDGYQYEFYSFLLTVKKRRKKYIKMFHKTKCFETHGKQMTPAEMV